MTEQFEGWIGDSEFPDPSSTPEEREFCEGVVKILLEAESYLVKGPDIEHKAMANLCCSDALIALGHFSELRAQRLREVPGASARDFWDVQILRVVTKGMNAHTVGDLEYDPEWKDDYRGRPEFLGPPPPA